MPTGVYKRTPECNAINSKSKKGVSKSPEHCAALTKALKGVPKPLHTSEHNAAIAKGMKNSDAVKAFRGGNDIVNHHYIYDESDLSKYTTKMTRSHHTWLHNLFRKLGYIVPHVNIIRND